MSIQTNIYTNIINNKFIKSDEEFYVTNPLTTMPIAKVYSVSKDQLKSCVNDAQKAFFSWKALTLKKRSKYLLELSKLITQNVQQLAELIVQEQGKPITEALAEINYANSFITSAVTAGLSQKEEIISRHLDGNQGFVYNEPYGVVGCITPWNFPAAMITRKIAPALITGNTVILKPSEITPLTALEIGKLAIQAGFPEGVFNVVCGKPIAISNELLNNPIIKKISFTGSTHVGKSIIQRSHKTVTKLSLELGGHAPFIVFEDANIDIAVEAAIHSKFRNCGQTCISSNRFFIHKNIYDEFINKLKDNVLKLKIGNGMSKDTNIGPLINEDALLKVESHIKDAINHGAQIICGGSRITYDNYPKANFFEPTIVHKCNSKMKIFNEETFGPICAIQAFDDIQNVITYANDSIYGLAAYVFTQDINKTFLISKQLNYGIISFNNGSPSHCEIPFGGFNQSGMGKEGGQFALDEYSQKKYISLAITQ